MRRIRPLFDGERTFRMFSGCIILCAFASVFAGTLPAGQVCSVPPPPKPSTAVSIFHEQQELDLGEIEAEWLEKQYHVIQDDAVAAHVNVIADRVLSKFPANQRKVRIIMIDTGEADSFSAGVERIYLTRQMVGLLQNDDELAGLLGHEIDHIARHQNAILVTQLFHYLLGVKAVTDRKDIEQKYHRMLNCLGKEEYAPREVALKMQREQAFSQYEADRVALYAAAAADFSPKAFAQFYDRTERTQGKTGNFLTDFFGVTKANERRLRKIKESLRQLPPVCRERTPAAASTEFLTWQANVMAYPAEARR